MESKEQPPLLEAPLRITEQVWPEGTTPVVSIWCITYNHANFIRDALESFLMQETTFPVEIFVHDDASTDGTADIVREYAERFPQLFWIVLQEENQWSKRTGYIRRSLNKQRGAFVAICEGDDYWTSPLKLQKQVDLLTANPSASGSFHPASVVDEKGTELELRPAHPVPLTLGFDDVVVRNHLLTCSLVYRATSAPLGADWSSKLPMGDWPLQVELTLRGVLMSVDANMGCYRRHMGGIWTRKSKREELRAISCFYDAVRSEFDGMLPKAFYLRYHDHHKNCLEADLVDKKYYGAFKLLVKLLKIKFLA